MKTPKNQFVTRGSKGKPVSLGLETLRNQSPQAKPLKSLKLLKPDMESFDGNSLNRVRDKTADTNIQSQSKNEINAKSARRPDTLRGDDKILKEAGYSKVLMNQKYSGALNKVRKAIALTREDCEGNQELKTLKDIEPCDIIKEGKDTIFNQIFGKQIRDRHLSEFILRQEAIKWVKKLEFRRSYQETSLKELYEKSLIESERWIKYFFNLTEANLK